MKKVISIPQPAPATRLAPCGKHSRGRAPKKQLGQITHPPLAEGKIPAKEKAGAKREFIGESQREGNRIARERAHKRELARWFAGLSAEDQAFARAHGLDKPLGTGESRKSGSNSSSSDALDFCDPADSIHASVNLHPVDELEPLGEVSFELDLSDHDLRVAADCFSSALRWALDGADLVAMGRRLAVVTAEARPDLGVGMVVDRGLRADYIARFDSGDSRLIGIVFGRALEWARRGSSLSALGERLYLLAYVLRPQLIDARTLQSIGDLTNKTRQAKDKLANCLRDTFAGLKAHAMRSDITRTRCRHSQLLSK